MKQSLTPLPSAARPPVRVVLVEDKPGVRDSWVKLINSLPGFSCIQSCTSGEDALRVIPPLNPDVVLMDIFLPRMSGIECTARLKLQLPKIQILILTAVEDDELVFMALEAGADGYLLKRTKPEDLKAAMLDVLGGGAPMTSEIARRVVESFRRAARQTKSTVHLTTREEEVLILLSKGYANKEIADQLSISAETVGSHLKHIYEKMHVRSRAEAVARYMTSRA
ncbi:MAG: response regulator transcription factor [Verrucomicrobiae bacterium]|nr:response regulator transcription factor [Verrucomicrobiae bacterium]